MLHQVLCPSSVCHGSFIFPNSLYDDNYDYEDDDDNLFSANVLIMLIALFEVDQFHFLSLHRRSVGSHLSSLWHTHIAIQTTTKKVHCIMPEKNPDSLPV